jgi:MoxR-like ATPase
MMRMQAPAIILAAVPDDTPEAITASFAQYGFVTPPALAVALSLAARLEKPLLLEGPPGVGKTEVAKLLAAHEGARLVRLQCYEGLDEAKALYEWAYGKQILYAQLLREKTGELLAGARDLAAAVDRLRGQADRFFSREFLLPRPLLEAVIAEDPVVLLIDEVDRADEEFEAFLLEVLSDWQVTIPELGTIRAKRRPRAILTSNDARELSDALRRRCLYHFIDYPSEEEELRIVEARVPALAAGLARRVVQFVARVRGQDLRKTPGIAETIDWAAALVATGASGLSDDAVERTIGALLKTREDIEKVRSGRRGGP